MLGSNSCFCKLSIWLSRFNSLRTGVHGNREKISIFLNEKYHLALLPSKCLIAVNWLDCVFPPECISLIKLFTLFCSSGKGRKENVCIYYSVQRCKSKKTKQNLMISVIIEIAPLKREPGNREDRKKLNTKKEKKLSVWFNSTHLQSTSVFITVTL